MEIRDFAGPGPRGVERGTVLRYIKRHPEMFAGHTRMAGNKLLIDEVAAELLDKQYPMPQPVEIIEDVATIRELAETRKQLIELQGKYNEACCQLAAAEAAKILLEDRTAQLQRERERADRALHQADTLAGELSRYKKTIFGLYRKK